MLVLSRKTGQRITIGADVEIQVMSIRGNAVRIGVSAPAEVQILRDDAKKTNDSDGRELRVA